MHKYDHTLALTWLCETVVMVTKQVHGKAQNSTPGHTQAPPLILTKLGMREYVVDGTRQAKFYSNRFSGFCSQNTWLPCVWCDKCFKFSWVLQQGYNLQLWTNFDAKHVQIRRSGTAVPFWGSRWLYCIVQYRTFMPRQIIFWVILDLLMILLGYTWF